MTTITELIANRDEARRHAAEARQHHSELTEQIATGDASVKRQDLTDAAAEIEFTQQVQQAAERLLDAAVASLPVGEVIITRDAAAEAELGGLREQLTTAEEAANGAGRKLTRARVALAKAETEEAAARRALVAAQQAGLVDVEFAEQLAETLRIAGALTIPAVISHNPLAQPEPWGRPVLHVTQEQGSRAIESNMSTLPLEDAAASGKRSGTVALSWYYRAGDVIPGTDAVIVALRGKGWDVTATGETTGCSLKATELDGLRVDILNVTGWPTAPKIEAGEWDGLALPSWVVAEWVELGQTEHDGTIATKHGVRLTAVAKAVPLAGGKLGVARQDIERDEAELPGVVAGLVAKLGATGVITEANLLASRPAWAARTKEVEARGRMAPSATVFAEVTTKRAAA